MKKLIASTLCLFMLVGLEEQAHHKTLTKIAKALKIETKDLL